jgi:hypothetical protein
MPDEQERTGRDASTAAGDPSLQVVTHSQLKVYRRCAREHYFTYVRRARAVVEAEALRFGTLLHLALAAWWQSTDDRLAAGLDAIAAAPADDFERARARVLIRGYDARWSGDPYETLAVEAQFEAPLRNPLTGALSRTFRVGGKLDVVARDLRDDRVRLVEHKTSSTDISPGSDYWKRLLLDAQISTYFDGGEALGFTFEECLYDVIGKPALRPAMIPVVDADGLKIVLDANGERVSTKQGKWRQTGDADAGFVVQTRPETVDEFEDRLLAHVAENPDRYYQRGVVVRLEAERIEAQVDIWQQARLLREAQLSDRWPRNVDACQRYGGQCVFWAVCCGETTLEDGTRYRVAEAAHEELASNAA